MKTGPEYRYRLIANKSRRKQTHDVFDGTLQKTTVWLNDIMKELDWHDQPHKAYLALRTVLHTLRDRFDRRRSRSTWRAAADAGAWLLL